jgi:hypothetical protein
MRLVLFFGILSGLVTADIADASAKTGYDSPYSYERTWNAATRLVRVDMGFKILERDENVGYVLFEYKSSESGSKISHGSIEILKRDDSTSVIVQLPEMPKYHEQVMVDQLVRKLRAEYGDPPKLKPKDKPADRDAKDAGAGAREREREPEASPQ